MAAIAWQHGGLDAAFALAAAQQRPLFLYWGAAWCPPCNRVKSVIFTHGPLVERMAALLLFHLDGDSPGAQAPSGPGLVRQVSLALGSATHLPST